MNERIERASLIRRMRLRLERDSFPRVQMTLIVFVTGAVGFAASAEMLRAGLASMWLRYPIAVGFAYLAFLLLLWLWLRTRGEDYDFVEVPLPAGDGSARGYEAEPADADGDVVGEALSASAQADDFALPLAVIVLVGAAALSMLWVVYSAPLLFAELLVDGALAAGLYRKLKRADRRHWLDTAVQLTWRPFLITAVFLCALGLVMSLAAPEAKSLGGFIEQVREGSTP